MGFKSVYCFVVFALAATLFALPAFCLTATATSTNFGTIMQRRSDAYISFNYDGTVGDYDGIYAPTGIANTEGNSVTFTNTSGTTGYYELLKFDLSTVSANITSSASTLDDGTKTCSISIKNMAVAPASDYSYFKDEYYALKRKGGSCSQFLDEVEFKFQGTLVFNGLCPEATYQGEIYFDYYWQACNLNGFMNMLMCRTQDSDCDGTDKYVQGTIPFSFRIEEPLEATEVQAMFFGSIMPLNGGTVEIGTEDNLIKADGVTVFNTSAVRSGIFRVSGVGNRTVNITLPTSVEISSGSNSMTVNNFVASTNSVSLPNVSETEASETFSVGATLEVGANQAAGAYSGSYTVEVSY